jgi:Tfp pilus assembly protein PilF
VKSLKTSENLIIQGQKAGQRGEYVEAIDCFRAAINIQPGHARAHYLLGAAFQALNDGDNAIRSYQRAISIKSDYVDALNNLGVILQKAGSFQAAADNYKKVIELSSRHVGALYNMGLVKLSMGLPDDAVEYFTAAVQLAPRWSEARVELGNLLIDRGDTEAAAQHYAAALEEMPESSRIHYNLGRALQALIKLPEAAEHYRYALQFEPELLQAHNNLGLVYQDMGHFDEAMYVFEKAISMAESKTPPEGGQGERIPSDVEVEIRWHRSLLMLLLGDFKQGWQEYEWRWVQETARKRAFIQPLWDGSDITKQNILIYGEQGVGDEIMFASCFNDIISRAGHTVIDCDRRLAPLFQRSFPEASVHGGPQDTDISWLDQIESPDIRIPSGSLPRFLRKNRTDYFPQGRYLVCDPTDEADWRSRFSRLGAKYIVGISWKSGNVSKSQLRSTHLLQWQAVLSIADVAFVNLQYGDCKGELQYLREEAGLTVHDWPDANPMLDLDNFAAQISALDLVISIDNSTAHMSGALAVPTWIVQPYAPEWRWGINKEDSYWYPDIRQFHQQAIGDWDSVFREVAVALQQYIDVKARS